MAAAAGDTQARATFAGIYLDVVRAYLASRWQNGRMAPSLDDAVQEVFLECFRAGGALHGVDREGSGAFRTFLYGVVRNVARRVEERLRRNREISTDAATATFEEPTDDSTPSAAFDRAWAQALVVRARDRQRREAVEPEARRRVELLDLRFRDGLPIRDIAKAWELPAERVHAMYRRAREEFKASLRAELSFHGPADPRSLETECARILSLLGSER